MTKSRSGKKAANEFHHPDEVEVRIVNLGAARADGLLDGDWILLDGKVGQVVKVDFHGASRVEVKARVHDNARGSRNQKRLVERTTEFQCLALEMLFVGRS